MHKPEQKKIRKPHPLLQRFYDKFYKRLMAQFLLNAAMEVARVLKKKHQVFMVLILFTVSPACVSTVLFEGDLLTDVVSEPSAWIPIIWRIPSIVDPSLNDDPWGVPPIIPWLPNPFTEDLSVPWESPLQHRAPLAQWQEKKVVAAAGYTASGWDKLFRLQAYPAAIADFDKALSLTPEALRVYDARATANLQFGDAEAVGGNTAHAQRLYHAAIRDYTQVIARSPEKPDAYLFRGYATFKLGTVASATGVRSKHARHHYHAAITDANHALALSRKHASVLKEALALHTELGVASRAAMEMRGGYAFAHYVRGLAKEALGHHTAAADFRKARILQLVPEGCRWAFLVASKFGRVTLREETR